jgi:transposase-like protein
MEQRLEPPHAFSPSCPSCRAGTGHPIRVSMNKQQHTIEFRCEQCEHRWTETDVCQDVWY